MLLPMLTIYQEYVRNHHYCLQVSCVFNKFIYTCKSLSEALILGSTNPQYDKRLFIDLPVHENYKLRTWGEHVCINCSECQNKNKKQFVCTTCSPRVLSL